MSLPQQGPKAAKPPWQRLLQGQDARQAAELQGQVSRLTAAGKLEEALTAAEAVVKLRQEVQGTDHWQVANACWDVEALRRALREDERGRADYARTRSFSLVGQADTLVNKGRYREAQPLLERILVIRRKVLGEEHPHTAQGYNNLAYNLNAQGQYTAAEALYRKALAIRRKLLGEEHPDTATSSNNLAGNLNDQGQFAAAEPLLQKALAIFRKTLGEEHPSTATSYNNLAYNLHNQGKYAKAADLWRRASDCFAKARLRLATSGLARAAKTGELSPLPSLAAVLARNGKPEDAWQRFEEGLARGTWDDLSARLRRPPAEQAKQAELLNRLNRLDQLIEKTLSVKEPTAAQEQCRKAQDELDVFAHALEKTYGPAAGQVFDRQTIQAALPPEAALLGWLDLAGAPTAADPNGEHWAVLLRSAGPPVWVRLRGTGPKDAWTKADTRLPGQLRTALQSSAGKWQPLARRLRQQHLDPLAKYLTAHDGLPAVRRLLVLPSPALAGVPVETFAGDRTVSYALSGTLYAHLRSQPKLTSRGLLALADPPSVAEKPLPLPPGGVLLTMVAPRSNAAQAGLRPNDVLLRYGTSDLSGPADLPPLTAASGTEPVTVVVWRDGKTRLHRVQPGRLGVVLAGDPAPKALAEQRQWDRKLASLSRAGDWKPLPGTRVEVEGLRRLFGDPAATLLVASQASEQRLYDLARDGELGQYRYLHFATHGEVDNRVPLRSAVILARDALPDPLHQLHAGLPVFDGRLTAEKVLRQWHLHSELVTLSACETALGKYEGGEGFVGFAQALLLSGSRSVCLSLWKVDDAATALLMERFYEDLLGKRDGLKGPLGKAEALREAKAWLRGLSREEALKRVARLSGGVERAKGRPALPLLPPVPEAPAGRAAEADRPYAHPYYWAAFVLIGDPD